MGARTRIKVKAKKIIKYLHAGLNLRIHVPCFHGVVFKIMCAFIKTSPALVSVEPTLVPESYILE